MGLTNFPKNSNIEKQKVDKRSCFPE